MKAEHVRRAVVGLTLALTVAVWAKPSAPGAKSKLIPAAESGWSQWRGPRRDGVSDETGLLASWPAGGPKQLWTAGALGKGYSSPVVARIQVWTFTAALREWRVPFHTLAKLS